MKVVTEFYHVAGRKSGLASWCKRCSNAKRKTHKVGEKKASYVVVAKAVKNSGKPTTCPTCFTNDVPPHRMRGRVDGGAVVFECYACRTDNLRQRRAATPKPPKVSIYCDWCCKKFKVTAEEADRVFCGDDCRTAWQSVATTRSPETQALLDSHVP